ncbi:MAG: ankyrin repeat domain-containing protein [Candidatus Chromulinivorax sp.]|nr:ankyrin repeat domain-containing protein [Candidatus Chromulinivorax sp.]
MNKIMLVLLTLCCAIQTMCSTENIVPKSHDSEYRERIGQIAKSCSSEHFNISHKDRIPAQHGIPTLHEMAFQKLVPAIIEAITCLPYNEQNKSDYKNSDQVTTTSSLPALSNDEQRRIDFAKWIIQYSSPHALQTLINTPISWLCTVATPLEHSTFFDQPELTRYLLDAGADVNKTGDEKRTALHCAAKRNRYKAISLLIAAGAYINLQDSSSNTPLHLAVLENSGEAITLLIATGADTTIQNIDGKTPRMCTYNPTTLQIFDQAIAARPLKQKSATKIQALGRGFIARKNK